MSENVELLHGWYSLHDFRRFDRETYHRANPEERQKLRQSLTQFCEENEAKDRSREGSFGIYEIVGHKADLLFLTLRPTLAELSHAKRQMSLWPLSSTLSQAYSYVGLVELSNYVVTTQQRSDVSEMIDKRLRPSLPHKESVCFYPMNKKREGADNWYSLPMEERSRMMRAHGKIGRMHAETIMQMISGSIGLDDYEWGVTLFADDPLSFKKVVTDMRFDEVSARFAEFGSFLVGCRLSKEKLVDWFESGSGG